jgi:DNA-binding NarL/FixJ family response regulator
VLFVDDHRTFVDLLRIAVVDQRDLRCVGVAYDLDSGLAMVDELVPDVVVLDVCFEGDHRDGVSVTGEILGRHPDMCVVLLTARSDHDLLRRAAAAGASAIAPKNGSLEELLHTLGTARPGGLTVHPDMLRALMPEPVVTADLSAPLSPREQEVLGLLDKGLSTSAIAARLGINVSTCRGYVKSLLHKVGAHSQLEAVALARERGLVDVAPRP